MKSTLLADKAAASKAMESLVPQEIRLFDDPYSVAFISRGNRFYIKIMKLKIIYKFMMRFVEKLSPGVVGGLVCRTRYLDDVIKAAIEDGFETVVNLGGGYDTRCLRIENMSNVLYYHIDQPDVIDSFKEKMGQLSQGIPSNVRFVPIDFNHQSLEEELARSGYDKTKKTLFIWEGVTQYIDEEALIATFRYIASAKPGSRIAFTYVLKGYLENPMIFPEYAKIKKTIDMSGVKWINGLVQEEMGEYLEKYGLRLIEDVGAADYQERYLSAIERDLDVMPIERISLAEVIE